MGHARRVRYAEGRDDLARIMLNGLAGAILVVIGISACAAPSPSAAPAMSSGSQPVVSPGPPLEAASEPSPGALGTPGALATPSALATPIDAAPLTPTMVEARLRTLNPRATLVAWIDGRDVGVFPQLVFRATGWDSRKPPYLNAVLVFSPTSARREA